MKDERQPVTLDEVRNKAHRVGDRAGDLVRAIAETPLAQRAATVAGVVAAAASAGFFAGSLRRRS